MLAKLIEVVPNRSRDAARPGRMRYAVAALLCLLAAALVAAAPAAAEGVGAPGTGWHPATALTVAAWRRELTTIFTNTNVATVHNGARRSTVFSLDREATIVSLRTYHWNKGRGARPGTVALRSSSGRLYGPWQTVGSSGQGGVRNAYWTASPQITLRPGTYTILDSDPSTWAQNRGTGGAGMAWVEGWYH